MPAGIDLTDEQKTAVLATGRSVIVSAAAGAGKTRVLAERCARLVCDAPEPDRCNVDALLVLTFTDAAAAEMRSRIADAIRRRAEADPTDIRLREQLLRVDAAHISTIHSFCLWMVRRWFTDAGTDPLATLLDAEESSLLKMEVLDELFERHYAQLPRDGNILGADELSGSRSASCESPFLRLVNVYGLGDDRGLKSFVLRLFEFTHSLPDPEDWLSAAVTGTMHPEWTLGALTAELKAELQWQIQHCGLVAEAIERGDSCTHYYAQRIRAYAEMVTSWLHELDGAPDPLAAFNSVQQQIHAFEFGDGRAPPLRGDEAQKAARQGVSPLFNTEVKKDLFANGLRARFGLFSIEEWLEGMRRTAPFVAELVEIVRQFGRNYAARKRRLNVLDFADLERMAYDLVRGGGESAGTNVAGALRDRFEHVLVDEFQDINPLQQAILQVVSRESAPDRPDNLFVVGDVKQSIYRFRLAEPEIFLGRLHRAHPNHETGASGLALFLQHNFRSRPEILETVNEVFRPLMSGDGLQYDDRAHLRPGKPLSSFAGHFPVEVHFLPRRARHQDAAGETEDNLDAQTAPEDASNGLGGSFYNPGNPLHWETIEREAYLIGQKIKELTSLSGSGSCPPRHFRDICVLLRSIRYQADRVAGILTAMDIPAFAEVGGSLLKALEIRQVLAVLSVLDNPQQDIPLAAVLRGGILGDRFSEDELVEIRLIDREIPFHAAVRDYVRRGRNNNVRLRLAAVLDCLAQYREQIARRPLAETLWDLLERQGYMAYVCGLPNGAQRRANLLKLHELARRFGAFRRQGLHRFLRFAESLTEEDKDIGLAPIQSGQDNVVRIMSVHRSKGMEFPVVFLAGLGSRFNLGDRKGRMIYERKARIGLRAIETDRMIEYPTAAHRLAASEIERSTRDEELRILYVGMTRARERLFLVGSLTNLETLSDPVHLPARVLTRLRVATAQSALDWLVPVFCAKGPEAANANYQVHMHDETEIAQWRLPGGLDPCDRNLLETVSQLEELPAEEPASKEDPVMRDVLSRLQAVYPWLAASSLRATVAASEFEGTFADAEEDLEHWAGRLQGEFEATMEGDSKDRDAASQRGILIHRALQEMDFARARDASGVNDELERLIREGHFAEAQRAILLGGGIDWFVTTPLAQAIRQADGDYRRELRFVSAESLAFFDPTITGLDDDRVLVRGIVDGILIDGGACEIVDFKTDAVSATDLETRCEIYRPQMELYTRAVQRLLRRPVRRCHLVFLTPRQIVDLRPRLAPCETERTTRVSTAARDTSATRSSSSRRPPRHGHGDEPGGSSR